MVTKARYGQVSGNAQVLYLLTLMDVIVAKLAEDSCPYGEVCRGVDFVNPRLAQDCVDAIDALPIGEDPANYVYLAQVDMMCRSSFVWDLRAGDIPETGSSSTVPHQAVPLSPGRAYFAQFIHHGECEPLIGEGWATYYYSETRCMETLKLIEPLVGKDWDSQAKRVRAYQGVPQSLIASFKSYVAPEIEFSLTLVGQGKIRWVPKLLKDMKSGQRFFNVMDTEYNRVRAGTELADGTIWQA